MNLLACLVAGRSWRVYRRKPAEGFLINVEPAYVLQEERVQEEDVRLRRYCLGLYWVTRAVRGLT
jgi:hypothetical protein